MPRFGHLAARDRPRTGWQRRSGDQCRRWSAQARTSRAV